MSILNESLDRLHAAGGRIVFKEGWFWETLAKVVWLITLGQNKTFLTDYYTTIGPWVGVPWDWELYSEYGRAATIEHETVHVKQCRRCGFGNVYLGILPFSLLYIFAPLPIGLAWFRWRFEREAYAHGIRFALARHDDPSDGRFGSEARSYYWSFLIDQAVDQLTGGAYAWTWPFRGSVRAYFEREVPLRPWDSRLKPSSPQ